MKIIMVCLGNICRSPLAEGILKEKARARGLEITIDSAGTAAYHAGERPDRRSQQIARKHGIDISQQRARQFQVADFDLFDKIYVMDINNFEDIVSLAGSEKEAEKVELILNTIYPEKNLSVPDPYYGGNNGFEKVYRMLDASCEKIVEDILANNADR